MGGSATWSHMPSIVFNANAPLKDRNGIAKRDPTAGASTCSQLSFGQILLLALPPPTLDVSVVASSASEGKSNGRRALLHLSLWQDRFLCCYRDQKRGAFAPLTMPDELAVLDADHSLSVRGQPQRFHLRCRHRWDQSQRLLPLYGLARAAG